jgi:hypothetical protein
MMLFGSHFDTWFGPIQPQEIQHTTKPRPQRQGLLSQIVALRQREVSPVIPGCALLGVGPESITPVLKFSIHTSTQGVWIPGSRARARAPE